MTVKERILTIRLMEKANQYPAYAKALGIEASGASNLRKEESEPKGLTDL